MTAVEKKPQIQSRRYDESVKCFIFPPRAWFCGRSAYSGCRRSRTGGIGPLSTAPPHGAGPRALSETTCGGAGPRWGAPAGGKGLGGSCWLPPVPAPPAAASPERRTAAAGAPLGLTGNGVRRGRGAGAERQDGGGAVWAGSAGSRGVTR